MYIPVTLTSAPAMKNLLGRITHPHTNTFRNGTVLLVFSELFPFYHTLHCIAYCALIWYWSAESWAIAIGIHKRLNTSNTLNHLSDCSVQCAKGTRHPEATVPNNTTVLVLAILRHTHRHRHTYCIVHLLTHMYVHTYLEFRTN